ncbi:hypothetical protein KSL82_04825 [Limosilactobacillus portuensis]|uniref:DnaD domain-containing protein n=1 Tax=Limosilactobacillus portuensis TaxID=2742601 RepID=A0ABS6IYJ7_9LACO|nr:hypothetical protein [Limosilactobacillus portuensis]MBU9695220.1 hypothetical protein [Limosilactobacillus portuensis]
MNYLKQIIAFDKWEELHPLSDKAYRLWLKLMAIANASGWDEWLSVPLLKLKSELHTSSDQTIMNARNSLVQAGRIEVRKGKHGKSAGYRLIPFSESLSGVPNGDGSGVKSGEDSGGLHGVKGGEDSGTYYKQNKTKQNKTNNSDKSPATRHKTQQKFADDSVEMQLAMYLFSKIKENNPDHKKLTDSQKQKWADSIRLMIERDNRSPKQIKNMVDWCQADSFWRNNILSTAKLRKQYDTMAPKANAQWQSNQQRKRVYS